MSIKLILIGIVGIFLVLSIAKKAIKFAVFLVLLGVALAVVHHFAPNLTDILR